MRGFWDKLMFEEICRDADLLDAIEEMRRVRMSYFFFKIPYRDVQKILDKYGLNYLLLSSRQRCGVDAVAGTF